MKGKNIRNNYIIFALICLIVFNIGTFLINATGDESNFDLNNEVETVFNQEPYFEEQQFFITLFSRTSSIINLYKNQKTKIDNFEEFSLRQFLSGVINDFMRSQLPAILNISNKSGLANIEGLNEDNIEDYKNDPTIVEDFIIIDELEEYEDLIIVNDSEGKGSLENVPEPLNIEPLKINKQEPYVLIYHTHGTESYSSLENDKHHTEDRDYNVTTIGEIIAETLKKNGHKVDHVTKYHDVPSYNQSYAESLKTIKEKLKENSNFKILLDIHRDGFDHNDINVMNNLDNLIDKSVVKINGKNVATFFFIIGPDSPNKDAVLSFAKYVKVVTDVLYPGLCTGIIIKPIGKYNQFLSNYSALIEVGSNLNTVEEAKETSKILGEILSIVIDNIQD
ncbi:stage II sporulation protein P [Schnuerera sp. xch1]|uniref:stage II sporulation protein P n=1 Tax=Schnuerera sp. xch1 TaxID=2874283 RepID=UPI001CBB860B|nr:stage II sporulation protein P [Schnuerera sp. xch1]MBZ2175748.1 stage II sporulation protein P [Schnuerera sp. xch1]